MVCGICTVSDNKSYWAGITPFLFVRTSGFDLNNQSEGQVLNNWLFLLFSHLTYFLSLINLFSHCWHLAHHWTFLSGTPPDVWWELIRIGIPPCFSIHVDIMAIMKRNSTCCAVALPPLFVLEKFIIECYVIHGYQGECLHQTESLLSMLSQVFFMLFFHSPGITWMMMMESRCTLNALSSCSSLTY